MMMSLRKLDASINNFNKFRFNGGQNTTQSAAPYGYLTSVWNPSTLNAQSLNQSTVSFDNNFPYYAGQNASLGNSFRFQCDPPPPVRMPEGVNAIAGNQDFKTLTTALGAAGLVDTLKGLETKKPITVLAPTEAAFGKVEPKLLQSLLKPENKAFLQQILEYHVSDMKFPSNQQSGKARFDSLLTNNNDETVISLQNGQPSLVNGAQKIQGASPVKTPNGSTVIPIDQVLIPPGFDVDALNADKKMPFLF
jgi:uncharacterized surface protein with fasciclin (FAS1) repeats